MEKETDLKASPKNEDTKEDYQLYWILGVMIVVIVVFFVSVQLMERSRVIEYEGITFNKVMFGEIPLYQYLYKTPIFSKTVTGKVIQTGERDATVLLRNDPSKNTVPIEGETNYISRNKTIYVTFSSEGLTCEYSTVAVAGLSSFLGQNGYVVEAGTSNESEATALTPYVTCESRPDSMVLSLEGGNKSSIVVKGNCHTLIVADCEILDVTEKFIVQSLVDAKKAS